MRTLRHHYAHLNFFFRAVNVVVQMTEGSPGSPSPRMAADKCIIRWIALSSLRTTEARCVQNSRKSNLRVVFCLLELFVYTFSLSRGHTYQAMLSLAMHNSSQLEVKPHRSPLFARFVEDKSTEKWPSYVLIPPEFWGEFESPRIILENLKIIRKKIDKSEMLFNIQNAIQYSAIYMYCYLIKFSDLSIFFLIIFRFSKILFGD